MTVWIEARAVRSPRPRRRFQSRSEAQISGARRTHRRCVCQQGRLSYAQVPDRLQDLLRKSFRWRPTGTNTLRRFFPSRRGSVFRTPAAPHSRAPAPFALSQAAAAFRQLGAGRGPASGSHRPFRCGATHSGREIPIRRRRHGSVLSAPGADHPRPGRQSALRVSARFQS